MSQASGRLKGRHVTLCITGSVAAYKAVLILRLLQQEQAELDVVLTRGGEQFVGKATLSGLIGRPVYGDPFDPALGGEIHVELGKKTDLVLIAPATADTLARLAGGRADDLIGALGLSTRSPLLLAPAMHPAMWENPATQRNVAQLAESAAVHWVGPVVGEVASGEVGLGRMAEPEVVVDHALTLLGDAPLRGRHVVITAGPTAEDLDPVRTLTNRSSGKMGFALAARAAALGARVTLIAGPVARKTPRGVDRVDVRSADSMRSALGEALGSDLGAADALIMAAAVADYRPAKQSDAKLASGLSGLTLELLPNPDLLAEIGHARRGPRPILVGFALETTAEAQAIASARRKLAEKRVDLVVLNRASEALERDDTRLLLVSARDCKVVERASKDAAAAQVLDFVVARCQRAGQTA